MIGRLIAAAPRRVIAIGIALFLGSAVLAAGAMDSLALNRYEAIGSDSLAARDQLAEHFDTGSPNIAVLVSAPAGVDTVADFGRDLTGIVAVHDGIGDAWSYWTTDAATLADRDGDHALILGWAPGDADLVRGTVLPALEQVLSNVDIPDGVTVHLGGGDEVFRVVAGQARADFLRAEAIILPLVLLLLWAVYRRFGLALVTLGIGLFSVVGTLAILRMVTMFTEVSTFAANIALVMGIGLGVDYGLFIVYRFREEMAAGHPPVDAARRTVATAGRTVLFSGVTVAASLAVLFVFPFPFLSSFAYAGIAVVFTALLGSVVVLPAVLSLLGHRAERRHRVTTDRWRRFAERVVRRPIAFGLAGLIALLALGAPALGIDFNSPDDRVLPAGQPIRDMYDVIRDDFDTEDADAIHLVTTRPTDPAAIGAYAAELSLLPGVQRVESAVGVHTAGRVTGDVGPGYRADAVDRLVVVPTGERLAEDSIGLVTEVRALSAPVPMLVGGYPAELADYRNGVTERLPLLAVLIVLVTFVILFVMTGSLLAPLKASILNLLSLTVMFGVLVWGFQEGGLASLLGFTPTGAIEPSIPILMFCIAYGLSMDYEVFLLSRIKADYDRTGDVVGSIPRGIAASAPLVTAAAVILAASFAVYATSQVSFLQQLGIGMALAVIVDATIIRAVMVPALMRLAGRANWWAPAPLRRLHHRIGLREDLPEHEPIGR
ncbi:RND superfamily putative drug exporter [Stackebrandtia endophytica]|uniref:RND superfamily putative drug exporter n=1 Tax=Stackebrandtia endophytica TaxID=1496996 RepID=A0A543AZ19_9ACTN|nr:MMPL family transporter [Stackebrandtia endophytica]TQL77818.1 RND superfamily putative drug exporter [Stackebrandtia endophytica]